jgi:hypothetical protein
VECDEEGQAQMRKHWLAAQNAGFAVEVQQVNTPGGRTINDWLSYSFIRLMVRESLNRLRE